MPCCLRHPAARVALLPATPCSSHALQPVSPCCPLHPAARTPCSQRRPAACVALHPASPYCPRALLPVSPSCPHAQQPTRCPARPALQPARCPVLQPACCPFLQLARRLPAADAAHAHCAPCPHAALAAALPMYFTAASGGGQQQQHQPETLSLQQLCEWVIWQGRSGTGAWDFIGRSGWGTGTKGTTRGTGQQRQQSQEETLLVQQLREWFSQWRIPGSAEAASLGACEPGSTGAPPVEALHTFTLDSGSTRCFFRDCTTVTPLIAPVPVSLADPFRGPVVARSSTILPYPAAPSGSLAGFYLPSFTTNLTLLWHHRLGHPSLPRLRSMHSRLLVSGLPRSLPPLPCSLAPPCLPCVEGRQSASPHSSFPPTTAPLQTLHLDVWGPAPVRGTDQERYFRLVVDDYTRYTMVFPLRSKADVYKVLIPWIRATRRQLRERFRRDLPVLCLHSDRGSEFSSGLLAEFCRDESIVQSFTLLASPHHNGIAEHRIGLIMEVALNLWPHVSLPETSPTLRWTGKVGDASAFWVWGTLPLLRDTTANKISPRTLPPQGPAPSAVGTGAAEGGDTGGKGSGGAETGGEGSGCAENGGEGSGGVETGGAVSPNGGGAVGAPAAYPSIGQQQPPSRLETPSPQQLREWVVRRGRSGAGAWSFLDAGGAAGAGGAAAAAGGAGAAGASGDGGAGAAVAGSAGAAGAGGTGAASAAGAAGAGGAGAACQRNNW
ncbi:unnamed protein product [Closterium sp. NIES-53]